MAIESWINERQLSSGYFLIIDKYQRGSVWIGWVDLNIFDAL